MFNQVDFENVVSDFLFSYRQFLLNGYLHKRVSHDSYEANTATWNTLLLSLEMGSILGLAKLLEREDDLGRTFSDNDIDAIADKIKNVRHAYIAHADLSKMRDIDSFLKKNRLSGAEVIKMIDALKKRLIQYQQKLKFDMDVQKLFTESQNNALHDLDSWLKSFKTEL